MTAFKAERIVRGNLMLHSASAEQVFPLLCPVLEYDWIPHWRCDLVHSASGVAELDCVFTTAFPDQGPQTWTCTRYEPPRRIEYAISGPHHLVRLAIDLEALSGGGCRSVWIRTYTGLDRAGNELVAEMTETKYAAQADLLESLLNHYLATGTMRSE